MTNNFFPLSSQELINRINKIPKIKLAILPTALEYLPNISKELGINLYIKRDDCTALAFGGNKTRHLEFIMAKVKDGDYDCVLTGAASQSNWCRQTVAAANKLNLEIVMSERWNDKPDGKRIRNYEFLIYPKIELKSNLLLYTLLLK